MDTRVSSSVRGILLALGGVLTVGCASGGAVDVETLFGVVRFGDFGLAGSLGDATDFSC